MNETNLVLPRRLAIELLAHAQRQESGTDSRGYLEGTEPEALRFRAGDPPEGAQVWALVRDRQAPVADAGTAAPRVLAIALDTKGVLQLSCWNTASNPPTEQPLRIR